MLGSRLHGPQSKIWFSLDCRVTLPQSKIDMSVSLPSPLLSAHWLVDLMVNARCLLGLGGVIRKRSHAEAEQKGSPKAVTCVDKAGFASLGLQPLF